MKTLVLLKLVVVFILIGSTVCFGQKDQEPGVVYLKDGSVLIGEIIEDTEYHIKIIIETGDTLIIGYRNIIEGEDQKKIFRRLKEKSIKEEGYLLYMGVNPYLTEDGIIGATGIFSKILNKKFHVGLSVNFFNRADIIEFSFIDPHILNFGLYGRYNLNSGSPRFYIAGQSGYGIVTNSNRGFNGPSTINGGFQGAFSSGLVLASRSNIRWNFSFGVKYNQTSGEVLSFSPFNGESVINYSKNYLTPYFGIGMEF